VPTPCVDNPKSSLSLYPRVVLLSETQNSAGARILQYRQIKRHGEILARGCSLTRMWLRRAGKSRCVWNDSVGRDQIGGRKKPVTDFLPEKGAMIICFFTNFCPISINDYSLGCSPKLVAG